jgi:hypothetical protein
MPRICKQLTDQEIASIQTNPPVLLNTFQTAALLEKSIRTIREWFNEDDFPVMRGNKPNAEKYVLRDDLYNWMKGQAQKHKQQVTLTT